MSTLRVDSLQGQTAGTDRYVVQVVTTHKTDRFTTTSTSYTDITGATATITPKSSNNKVLVTVNAHLGNNAANNGTHVILLRDGTEIGSGTGAGSYNMFLGLIAQSTSHVSGCSNSFLDSPNTTNAVTYKLQMKASNGTASLGGRGDSTAVQMPTAITLMEIAQ